MADACFNDSKLLLLDMKKERENKRGGGVAGREQKQHKGFWTRRQPGPTGQQQGAVLTPHTQQLEPHLPTIE